MQALIFIQKLQQILIEIRDNNSNPIFFVEFDYILIQQVKKFIIDKLREQTNIKGFFVHDLLSRDIFSLRLKYCIVKLKEFSISEELYFEYISKAINIFLSGQKEPPYFEKNTSLNIDDLLIFEISKCFHLHYRPEDIFLHDFAQDHQLIFRNFKEKKWVISNLGDYFLKMSTFQALTFLCSLEIVLTLEHHRYTFLSKNIFENIVNGNIEELHPRPYSLTLLGIITTDFYGNIEITDLGRKTVSYVQENLDLFRNIILFLLESEATGVKYPTDIEFDHFLKIIQKAIVLADDQRKSIQNAISFYRSGQYLDSLRIIYPIVESVLDFALKRINLTPSDFNGMKSKTDKLEKESVISSKVSANLEIYSSRNKILHGNIFDNDPEIMRPLFFMVLAHLKMLILELEKSAKIKTKI